MVFQSYEQLFPWLPVWENVAFPLRVIGVGKAERRKRALEALHAVGLDQDAEKYPHQLSGGMKQRVALARAWTSEPQLLLMDEPFGGLDMMTRESLQDLLLALWRKKQWTVVFITHDLREAARLSTDLLILRENGKHEWKKNELSRPRNPYSAELNQWIQGIVL
jgi:NitT/TauT family transport system ATP-binding protein